MVSGGIFAALGGPQVFETGPGLTEIALVGLFDWRSISVKGVPFQESYTHA